MNNISLYNYGLSDEEGESKFIDTQGYSLRMVNDDDHKVEHYLEIPLLINAFSNDYKLYFRHHSMAPAESVIYAI